MTDVSRRGLLGYGAAGGAVALGAAGLLAVTRPAVTPVPAPSGPQHRTYDPFGRHQAGIDTPTPAATTLVAYDLLPSTDALALARLLRVWSSDIPPLMEGKSPLGDPVPELSYGGVSLTVTVGFGPGIFALTGLETKRPDGFLDVPPMTHDKLQSRWSGGDLLVMVAADDATSVAYAERVMTRDAAPFATVRWRQTGSWRGTDGAGQPLTGRNLFGQVDGTGNPTGIDLEQAVWSADTQGWFAGGTTMVLRRIEMNLDVWDTLNRERQEKVIGRRLSDGSPLTGQRETDALDLGAVDATGQPVIPTNAHARLAHPDVNGGRRMLRRGLNYTDDSDGIRRSGLLFIAFVRSIAAQFTPVQQRLDAMDALNEWTAAIGSSIWALPGGIPRGGWLAQGLVGPAWPTAPICESCTRQV